MIGKSLGHYQITEKLGEGGMGVVYRAHDEQLDRDVAIKVLPSASFDDPYARARLLREARTASKLNHPHICTIYEVGEHAGHTFIAMELVEGVSLSALLEEGPLPVEKVQRYGLQLADALAHAHERGIIHRDFKSANVMVTNGRAKVLDFGLAKRQRAKDLSETVTRGTDTVTGPGMVAGTLAYMAPEQLRGRPADARSDIWSLGVVLYEVLAGMRPFQGNTGFEVSSAIMSHPPPPLATGPTGPLPPGLGTIIERCLEKDPDQRYQRCADVRAALEAVQSGGAVPAWAGSKRRISRRVWLALAAMLAVTLAAVIAVLMGLNLEGFRDRLLGGAGVPRFHSLAVLPVANLSGDPAEEYYADGMTYTLIANVSKIGSLRVISRSSVMGYKGATKPLPEIARELNVDTVLETSVAREGGRVHVTAQLIEAAAERHLWAETYDRPATDVLRLQSEVAREIARQVNVTLTPEQASRLTSSAHEVNPKLYEAYVRGKFYVSQNNQGSFEKGMQYLHQAVEIDPAEPLAWVGLAEGYIALGHGGAELIDIFPKARAAAEQALKLDPDAAEAAGVLAEVALYYEWDWVKAERLFKHALEVNPSLAGTHYHYAWYLALFNRLEEAIEEHKLARDHAPLQPANTAWLGGLYNFVGRYDEAIKEAQKAIELDSKFWPSYRILSIAYSRKGMHPEAIAAAQRIIEFNPFQGNAVLGAAYALAGQREQALAIAGRLEGGVSQRPQRLSELYAALGDRDAMFRGLEAAYEAHVTSLPWIRVHGGLYDSVRDDPRFQNLLRRMKLPL